MRRCEAFFTLEGVFGDGQAVDFHADQAVVLVVEVVGVQAVGDDVAGVVVGIARSGGGIVGRNRPEGVDGSQAVGGVGDVGLARRKLRLGQAGNGLHVSGPVVRVA
jgi:hypothetical protein